MLSQDFFPTVSLGHLKGSTPHSDMCQFFYPKKDRGVLVQNFRPWGGTDFRFLIIHVFLHNCRYIPV